MSLPLVLSGEAAAVRFAGEKEADTGLVYLLSEGHHRKLLPLSCFVQGQLLADTSDLSEIAGRQRGLVSPPQ